MDSLIVLSVGKRRIATKGLAGEDSDHGLFLVERLSDALVFWWSRDIDDLERCDSDAEELLQALGGDLLRHHLDARGVLVARAPRGELAASYAAIVQQCVNSTHVWLQNFGPEETKALSRDEIPVPNVPQSRQVELYVLSPARALRELALDAAPLRVTCLDRTTTLTPREVSAFYLPRLRERGFEPKRRIWSDGSTEELAARCGSMQVLIRSEHLDGGTFVHIAWIMWP